MLLDYILFDMKNGMLKKYPSISNKRMEHSTTFD